LAGYTGSYWFIIPDIYPAVSKKAHVHEAITGEKFSPHFAEKTTTLTDVLLLTANIVLVFL
jgi:hypothetical protein